MARGQRLAIIGIVLVFVLRAVAGEFGGRQEIYEIFFAGDPFLSRQLHYFTPRRGQYQAMVDRLLRESGA